MAAKAIAAVASGFLCLAVIEGCATAHENFVEIMAGNVGRSTNDPYVFRNRSRTLYVSKRQLANGNVEEEFRAGRGPTCRVYFEIDEGAEKIVAWRYQGTQEDCGVVP